MAYHGENDPDIPYDATARNQRNTESLWQEIESENTEKLHDPRDWAPKPLKSNYPRELIELATEEDALIRYDVLTRNRIREHLALAGLANSQVGITSWEEHTLTVQRQEARAECLSANRATREAKRQKRLERMAGRN
jgi:hypothetical protein